MHFHPIYSGVFWRNISVSDKVLYLHRYTPFSVYGYSAVYNKTYQPGSHNAVSAPAHTTLLQRLRFFKNYETAEVRHLLQLKNEAPFH